MSKFPKADSDRLYRLYVGAGDENKTAYRIRDDKALVSTSVSETITLSAGAAGTTGTTKFTNAPIMNANGTEVGKKGDTSLSWTTGTVLTTEVAWNTADKSATEQLAILTTNGDYSIDYETGILLYKKKTTGTTDTATYTVKSVYSSQIETHYGTVGTASDVDGVVHGQLRYIGEAIATATSVQYSEASGSLLTTVNTYADLVSIDMRGYALLTLFLSAATNDLQYRIRAYVNASGTLYDELVVDEVQATTDAVSTFNATRAYSKVVIAIKPDTPDSHGTMSYEYTLRGE